MVLIAAALAAAAVTGVFIFKRGKAAGSAANPAPIAAPLPMGPTTPATVRVNFNSDPPHAMVVRADTGKELGETPLSTEIAYGDTAIEFIFKKDGYENAAAFVVPNLPTPVSASLHAVSKPAPRPEPVVAASKPEPQAVKKPPAHKKATRVQKLDDDAVLEPTFK
jgi:hypothetical protein